MSLAIVSTNPVDQNQLAPAMGPPPLRKRSRSEVTEPASKRQRLEDQTTNGKLQSINPLSVTQTILAEKSQSLIDRVSSDIDSYLDVFRVFFRYEGQRNDDGLPSGFGKQFYNDKLIFEGQFDQGRKIEGTQYLGDRSVYRGKFVADKFHGLGRLIYPNGVYIEGIFNKGRCPTIGKMVLLSGKVYEGQFNQAIYNGLGTLKFPDGSQYTGQFRGGLYHGFGTLKNPEGKVLHAGRFEEGNPI